MLTGIDFQAPGNWSMRISFEAFKSIDPILFGQVLVMRLFNQTNILTQICGNNFLVLKVAPSAHDQRTTATVLHRVDSRD
jgi:ornithine--oxo-acid transaminase